MGWGLLLGRILLRNNRLLGKCGWCWICETEFRVCSLVIWGGKCLWCSICETEFRVCSLVIWGGKWVRGGASLLVAATLIIG